MVQPKPTLIWKKSRERSRWISVTSFQRYGDKRLLLEGGPWFLFERKRWICANKVHIGYIILLNCLFFGSKMNYFYLLLMLISSLQKVQQLVVEEFWIRNSGSYLEVSFQVSCIQQYLSKFQGIYSKKKRRKKILEADN